MSHSRVYHPPTSTPVRPAATRASRTWDSQAEWELSADDTTSDGDTDDERTRDRDRDRGCATDRHGATGGNRDRDHATRRGDDSGSDSGAAVLHCLVVGCVHYKDGRRQMNAKPLRVGDALTLRRAVYAGSPCVAVMSADCRKQLGHLDKTVAVRIDAALARPGARVSCVVAKAMHTVVRSPADGGPACPQSVVKVRISMPR
jgi:hypothetical protein